MAYAHKCDRCGEYHDRRIYSLDIEPMFPLSEDKYNVELCPACKSEFDEFMDGVKPKDLLGRLQALFK